MVVSLGLFQVLNLGLLQGIKFWAISRYKKSYFKIANIGLFQGIKLRAIASYQTLDHFKVEK